MISSYPLQYDDEGTQKSVVFSLHSNVHVPYTIPKMFAILGRKILDPLRNNITSLQVHLYIYF